MSSFITNYKIAQTYNVTPATVQKWVDKALKGSIELEVGEHEGRIKIQETAKNHQKLLVMSKNAKKYNRFREAPVEIKIQDSIYATYSQEQLYYLVAGLRNGFVPLKYIYLGEKGVYHWNKFFQISQNKNAFMYGFESLITSQINFLLGHFKDSITGENKPINIVDIGSGNGETTIPLIKEFHLRGLLNAYIALDISEHMLAEIPKSLEKNGLGAVNLHTTVCDFEHGLPISLISQLGQGEEELIPTLFIGFGGQLQNNEQYEQLNCYNIIRQVMSRQDLLFIINGKHKNQIPDNQAFEKSELFEFLTWLPTELGIIDDYYTPLLEYSPVDGKKTLGLKLNTNLNLNFEQLSIKVNLREGEVINVWKHRGEDFKSLVKLAETMSMEVMHYSVTHTDNLVSYVLKIS